MVGIVWINVPEQKTSTRATEFIYLYQPTPVDEDQAMSYPSIKFLVSELAPSNLSTAVPLPYSQSSSVIDLETKLNEFVQSALQKSCSGQYSIETSLGILDKAWKAQKFLWQLRQNLI
ncbi:hypothetical protein [Leptothermofonsia sp. ETS-13]|uniref:hypothetical protein n=1 Tax=Leptothermofonsia sp. ETS-13 TaxID=3035696 RepID=UPI003B9FC23B